MHILRKDRVNFGKLYILNFKELFKYIRFLCIRNHVMKKMPLNVTEVILLNNNRFGENFFRKISSENHKMWSQNRQKNRQKPTKTDKIVGSEK